MTEIINKALAFVKRYWLHILFALVIVLIYRGWLRPGPITYGDWRFYSTKHLGDYFNLPFAWDSSAILGQPNLINLYNFPLLFIAGTMAKLGIPFAWSERFVWLFPCVVLAPLSAYYLGKTIFKSRDAALATAVVFALNSCFLERFIGYAHVNIAAAFALAPLVFALLLRAKRSRGLRYPVLGGLALCLQGVYDLRISYLTVLIAIVGWLLLFIGSVRRRRAGVLEGLRWGGYLFTALGILLGANLFWIFPDILGPGFQMPGSFGQSWWIPVLSFNKLIHGFAMHDVSWPGRTWEQIGNPARVSPFFILFPLVGFLVVLVAIRRIKRDPARARIALAGSALVLAGVFLVSGASFPDEGRIYIWLFNNMLGFSMFRDPSKMYIFVMLGYSILFGLAVAMAKEWLLAKGKLPTRGSLVSSSAPAVVVLVMLCILALPAFSLSLGGISKPEKLPKSFTEIDRILGRDNRYYRLFWYPEDQQFSVKNDIHPSVYGAFFFESQLSALGVTKNPLSVIKSPLLPGILDAMAVGMSAVPEGSWASHYTDPEIARDKQGFVSLVQSVPGNSRPRYYGGTALFERVGGKDHFFVPSRTVGIIGGWDSALLALGAPGLDLNKSVYLLSERDQETARALTDNLPVDAYLCYEPSRLDATVPLAKGAELISITGAAKQGAPWEGWTPISTAVYSLEVANYLGPEGNERHSGDYGLGAALVTTSYETPPPDWLERAPLFKVISMGSHPLAMTKDATELRLEADSSSHAPGEKASIRGSLGPHPPYEDWRRAWSYNVKAAPLHPYGVRFSMSGRQVGELHTKVTFFNRLGQGIGEQVIWTGRAGNFDYQKAIGNFSTPPETASLRFEVYSRENPKVPSSWNLGNVEIFDLAGLTHHPAMEVKANVKKRATYRLLARVYRGPAGGRMSFSVDGGKPVLLDTRDTQGRVSWNEIRRFDLASGEHSVKVTNLDGTNLINALSLVTDKELAASERTLSNAISSRDVALVIDTSPKKMSYSSGMLTGEESIYCPVSTTLAPTFVGSPNLDKSGASLRINGTECDLRSAYPTVEPGWLATPPISIPSGEIKVEVGYTMPSLVNLPSSGRALTEEGWSSSTGGITLSAETSAEKGQMDLVGQLSPGDPDSMKIARSGMFEVKPRTKYSSYTKLVGQDCGRLQVALVMFDEDSKELARSVLTDEISGTFKEKEESREVETHYLARYAAVEVISNPDPKAPSSWRLSGLFLNESSSLASPIEKVALIPQSWAQGSAGTSGKEEPPPGVKVLKGSPTGYRLRITNAKKPFLLVFSEQYAPDWELFVDGKRIKPVPVDTLLNGYPLEKKGTFEVSIRYRPQKWVNIGLIPSILTLLFCFGFLIVNRLKR